MAVARSITAVLTMASGLLACGGDGTGDGAAPGESVGSPAVDAPAEVATSWNELILRLAEQEDGFLTLKGVRTTAMLHAAMHDALSAIDERYASFADPDEPLPIAARGRRSAGAQGVDPVAAAAHAAYRIASSQYPDLEEVFATERERWTVGSSGDSLARTVGMRAAEALIAAREGDGWDREAEYAWHPMGPGVYAQFADHSGTPEGFVFGAGWARARPFTLATPDQFRPPAPPEIDGPAYTRAFREVKEVGARESRTRTADQAHMAMWWKEFVERSHNRLAREWIAAEDLGLREATRFLALLNMAVFDGYVASFDAKFAYNHWRPYTAIRWAANDGNPDTAEDPMWTNLHDHTYAFPSYPSAHGTVCAAAMVVFADVFGPDRPVRITIPEVDAAGPFSEKIAMDPPTRSFESFADAAEECSLSRLYLGIHFRYDSEAGTALGRRVGENAVASVLLPREDADRRSAG